MRKRSPSKPSPKKQVYMVRTTILVLLAGAYLTIIGGILYFLR